MKTDRTDLDYALEEAMLQERERIRKIIKGRCMQLAEKIANFGAQSETAQVYICRQDELKEILREI